MIDEADRNGDGEIDEEEFVRIMKKTNLFWGDRREGSLHSKYFPPWISNVETILFTYTYDAFSEFMFVFDFIINTYQHKLQFLYHC